MNSLTDFRTETKKLKRANRDDKVKLSTELCDWAIQNGRLIRDPQRRVYLVDDQGAAVPLSEDSGALQVALHDMGLNGSEPAYRWFWFDLRADAARRGPTVALTHWAGHSGTTVKVSCGARAYIECDGNGLIQRVNGYAGTIFGADAALPEWDCTATPVHPETLAALHPPLAAPSEVPDFDEAAQRTLLLTWLCSLVAGIRPLPILGALGGRGSGKSSLARGLSRVVLGAGADLTPFSRDERDFWALVTRRPVVALDNLDEPDGAEWLKDALATTATGGSRQSRKLYTDAEIIDAPIDAALILTSRTAIWARADIAERTLPIFPRELLDSERRADSELTSELEAGRAGALAWLTDTAQKMLTWLPQAPGNLPARFLDFARMVWAYCAATGRPDDALPILIAWRKAQALAIADGDPLLSAILEYGPQVAGGMMNLSAKTLIQKLTLAGADVPYQGGGAAIAKKLRELRSTLLLAGWHLDSHKQGNNPVFSLWQ